MIFQFTPLREGRRSSIDGVYGTVTEFQFTPLREGRLCNGGHFPGSGENFNSRPSARGDGDDRQQVAVVDISIHAPPRGATLQAGGASALGYFNSRPSARGDAGTSSVHAAPAGFQFTPLREGRPLGQGVHGGHFNFNSRPSARGDRRGSNHRSHPSNFNSRPSARGDARQARRDYTHTHFNSRPSARGDRAHSPAPEHQGISIHAPPRGATAKDMQFLQIFCSTLTNQHGLTIVPRNLSRLFW